MYGIINHYLNRRERQGLSRMDEQNYNNDAERTPSDIGVSNDTTPSPPNAMPGQGGLPHYQAGDAPEAPDYYVNTVPRQDAPPYYQTGQVPNIPYPVVSSTKKRKPILWVLIAVCIVSVVGLTYGIVTLLTPSVPAVADRVSEPEEEYVYTKEEVAAFLEFLDGLFNPNQTLPMPVFIQKGDDIYLGLRDQALLLGEVNVYRDRWDATVNTDISHDFRDLYYLVDVNSQGYGDLMYVDVKQGKPEVIANDVSTAVVSADGKRVLYMTEVAEGAGTLYLYKTGCEAEEIAESVDFKEFGFSPNGENLFYVQQSGTSAYTYKLFLKVGKSKAIKVDEVSAPEYDSYSCHAELFDDGRLVYSLYNYEDLDKDLPIYQAAPDGTTKRVASNGRVEFCVGDGSVCSDERELFYCDASGECSKLSGKYTFALPVWSSEGEQLADRFMLLEDNATESDPFPETVTYYDQNINGEREKVCEADRLSEHINGSFTRMVYSCKERSYATQRNEDGKWSEPEELCKSAQRISFTDDEQYVYYLDYGSSDEYGELMRFDFVNLSKESIYKYVTDYEQFNGGVYISTRDGEAYLLRDGKEAEQISVDGADTITDTVGGVYIICGDKEKDMHYVRFGSTEPVTVLEDADKMRYGSGRVKFDMPLPSDAARILREMYEDALLILDMQNKTNKAVTDDLHRYHTETKDLAKEMRNRPDVPSDVRYIFSNIYLGFWDAEMAVCFSDMEYYDDAAKCLNDMEIELSTAVEDYENYMARQDD